MVKRLQVLQPPVQSRPHLAEIPAELDKAGVPLCLFLPFPRQNLVDFGEDKQCSLAIELRGHRRKPSKQVRQTDQDQLRVCVRVQPRPSPVVEAKPNEGYTAKVRKMC